MRIRTRNLRAQQHGKLVERAPYTSGADGQHGIAGSRFAEDVFDARLHRAREHHILVAGGANGVGQPLAADSLDRGFARRVDFGQHQDIGLIERTTEIIPEVLRARVAMRLEKNEQAAKAAAARGI
jgi:hypothetical protein